MEKDKEPSESQIKEILQRYNYFKEQCNKLPQERDLLQKLGITAAALGTIHQDSTYLEEAIKCFDQVIFLGPYLENEQSIEFLYDCFRRVPETRFKPITEEGWEAKGYAQITNLWNKARDLNEDEIKRIMKSIIEEFVPCVGNRWRSIDTIIFDNEKHKIIENPLTILNFVVSMSCIKVLSPETSEPVARRWVKCWKEVITLLQEQLNYPLREFDIGMDYLQAAFHFKMTYSPKALPKLRLELRKPLEKMIEESGILESSEYTNPKSGTWRLPKTQKWEPV